MISEGPYRALGDEQLEYLHTAAERFEAAFRAGEQVSIEDYLQNAAVDIREPLLAELLSIELELKWGTHLATDIGGYTARFPDLQHVVREVYADAGSDSPTQHTPQSSTHRRSANPGYHEAATLPECISRYRVEQELGRGEFGVVYRAFDSQLERRVAIKVPHAWRIAGPADAARLLSEARLTAGLDHDHIVPVYDVGACEQFPQFIVTKYVPAVSLIVQQRERPYSWQQAAAVVATLADALEHAHQRGIVHRDVKPSNILIDDEGKPYLVDFGLAVRDEAINRSPAFAGTPAYMSPEQARGEYHRLDGRSDIFSLGVVLYELLAGCRPFAGSTTAELLEQISGHEPRWLSELNPQLPRELERICFKALSKQAGRRYASAADMADDLTGFLADSQRRSASSSDRPTRALKIVPKGMRAFDEHDAEFFLSLLPGPWDRHGLPESVRFWKTRIERSSFSVGLLYGPSGCGKSSLARAGVLPQLGSNVISLPIECTRQDTEQRLRAALIKFLPESEQQGSLAAILSSVRQGRGPAAGHKLLIVLDQFEQWLDGHPGEDATELALALRQCDGHRIQCILVVRDDFWTGITRFMRDLDIPLLEGTNCAAADLFSLRHAEQVLIAYGRAHGALPQPPADLNGEQQAFVRQAVQAMAEDGRVICIRLALCAQTMKDRAWSPSSLKRIGGIHGIGVAFLDETFASPLAPPAHRNHRRAASAVLEAVLPKPGSSIKANMRSYDELLEASGYAERPDDFVDLLELLDRKLRLLVPIDSRSESSQHDDPAAADNKHTGYQLTHDYLVPSLRTWLTLQQQQTSRGRARLRLAERTALWMSRPEKRMLPSAVELLGTLLLTRPARWTPDERRMLQVAGRYHGLWAGSALAVVALAVLTFGMLLAQSHYRSQLALTQAAVAALTNTRGPQVPLAMQRLRQLPANLARQKLVEYFQQAESEEDQLPLAYALAQYGSVDIPYLIAAASRAPEGEFLNLQQAFAMSRNDSRAALRAACAACDADRQWRAKARLALLALALGDRGPAVEMARWRSDLSQRTILIDTFANWHGDLGDLAQLVAVNDDPAWISTVCLAVGSAEPVDERITKLWIRRMSDWYQQAPEAAVHGAAGWALRRWGVDEPVLAGSAVPESGARSWYVNHAGITMLRVDPGEFRRLDDFHPAGSPQHVQLTRAFWLGDREVTRAAFERFLGETAGRPGEGVSDWQGAPSKISPTPAHPIHQVSWYDAIQFCNWLSRLEGLTPCYQRTGREEQIERRGLEAWHWDVDANGYRLPTEAEWEYACRAGTTTAYAFGDDPELLDRYGVFSSSGTQVGGSKLPNAWGLFDMHGNLLEWCQDWSADYPSASGHAIDPIGADQAEMRVMRGGMYFNFADACRSGSRNRSGPWGRSEFGGFRVACSEAGSLVPETPDQVP